MSTLSKFTCSCCGKVYDEVPLCFGSDYPYHCYSIPKNEIQDRVELTESLCVIDDHFFHRGQITIPINDYPEDLVFNVWTTISKENFEIRNTLWNDPERLNQDPYFGYMQTTVPTYGDTLNIKTVAVENEVGLIPSIVIIEEEHPLRIDQLNGITFQEALEKVQVIFNSWEH